LQSAAWGGGELPTSPGDVGHRIQETKMRIRII